ncbi:MAG: hypothetical protein LBP74_06815 [Treponema sp.]|jgi:hypothetical protein|nr:hypothetical protein [Treponema sp.]
MLVLKENEAHLVEEVEAYIASRNSEEGALIRERFGCLRGLGEAISRYPPVKATQMLRGELFDQERLVESLCSFAPPSRLLHVPTRVVAIRGFLVAKYHAFSLLVILIKENADYNLPLRRILFSIICTLMAEEVYFSCLEDPAFPGKTKLALADDLISLWDSGTDPRSIRHLPALEALWLARDSAPPSFGTMDGASELIRLSIDLGEDWYDFLVEKNTNDAAKWALEEFLFGLSYEEILSVRSRLARFGISAVSRDEVHTYLGSHPAYQMVKTDEPRAIYDFYVDRRDAAAFRRRIGVPGPLETLEEIYLKYRILQE